MSRSCHWQHRRHPTIDARSAVLWPPATISQPPNFPNRCGGARCVRRSVGVHQIGGYWRGWRGVFIRPGLAAVLSRNTQLRVGSNRRTQFESTGGCSVQNGAGTKNNTRCMCAPKRIGSSLRLPTLLFIGMHNQPTHHCLCPPPLRSIFCWSA